MGEDRCARLRVGVYPGVSWALRKGVEGTEVSSHGRVRCDCGDTKCETGSGCETAVCLGDQRVPRARGVTEAQG